MGKLGIPAVPRNGVGHTSFDCLLGRLIGGLGNGLHCICGWFGFVGDLACGLDTGTMDIHTHNSILGFNRK
jgi:hypothetical protein